MRIKKGGRSAPFGREGNAVYLVLVNRKRQKKNIEESSSVTLTIPNRVTLSSLGKFVNRCAARSYHSPHNLLFLFNSFIALFVFLFFSRSTFCLSYFRSLLIAIDFSEHFSFCLSGCQKKRKSPFTPAISIKKLKKI